MKQLLIPAAAIFVLASVSIVHSDPHDIELQQTDCELVQAWEDDGLKGIPHEKRNGRPAISEEEKQRCKRK